MNLTHLHEAGHALALAVTGLAMPESVVVFDENSGSTRHAESDVVTLDNLVVAYAGGCATEAFGDGDPWLRSVDDLRHADEYARQLAPDDPEPVKQRAMDRARELMRAYRSSLECLAQSIVANGHRLGGQEVSRAVELAQRDRVWTRGLEADCAIARRVAFESRVTRDMDDAATAALWESAGIEAERSTFPAALTRIEVKAQ